MGIRKYILLLTMFLAIITISISGTVSALQVELDDACTSLAISPGATVDGAAMCTHTDDSGSDSPHIKIVPAKDWEPGSMRPVLRNTDADPLVHVLDPIYQTGEIPQVPHTYSYINAAYSFQNEMGVGMGESTISGARELRNTNGWFDVVDLMRVALERAASAREAIQIMGELAEKYGYGIGGEMVPVIDKDEAWVFEIYGPGPLWTPGSDKSGAAWVAQRVPDGEIAACGNQSIIGAIDLDDTDNFMASPNIYTLAEEMGMWDPNSGIEFRVHDTYGISEWSFLCSPRVWRAYDLVAPSLELSPWIHHYPFSVKPDKPVTVQDIMAINRDKFEGTEFDTSIGMLGGPFGNPNLYRTNVEGYPQRGGRPIAIPRTNYSTVVVSRKDMPTWIGSLTWFGYDDPAVTCYIPIYAGATELPKSFATGMRGGSYDVFSRESAWWAFKVVSEHARLIWNHMIEDIKEVREPLEEEFFTLQPVIEKTALELYQSDPNLARTFISNYTNSCANRVVDAYWDLAGKLFGRYNIGVKFADDVYKTERVWYPEWWVKEVDFGRATIPPEGYPWYSVEQQNAPEPNK